MHHMVFALLVSWLGEPLVTPARDVDSLFLQLCINLDDKPVNLRTWLVMLCQDPLFFICHISVAIAGVGSNSPSLVKINKQFK